jgi:hypothetical protein
MRSPAARGGHWLRRAIALAASVGMVLIASLAPATAVTRSTAGQPVAQSTARQLAGPGCPTPPSAPRLGVTVTGPQMYDPKAKAPFPCHSTVTVSQTRDLTNQMVKVSWTGFTPSSGIFPYSNSLTYYPVEVAECRGDSPGADPADLADPHCYWAANRGQAFTNGKYGPSNDVYTTSSAQGTGYVDIQLETFLQNQELGCSATHDCSLLILPVQGGITTNSSTCKNHSQDRDTGNIPYATAAATLVAPSGPWGDTCSWPYRIVVPLHFAPVASSCGFRNAAFSAAGSPLIERAMISWQSGLCNGANSDPYSYDGSVGEPQARDIFQAGGGDDVALTTQPAAGPGKHPFTYAPVGITATSVAYWVDDAKSGLPDTDLRLTPLLLTKMLTQSYEFGEAPPGYSCTPAELQNPPTTAPGCDPGVLHDPQNVLADPEFRQLNPGLKLDETQPATVGVPTVPSGNSDITWEVTRWIAADKASASFLAGDYDQWGEHVNTFYRGVQYPTQQFVAQDGTGPVAYTYLPVYPADKVATYQAGNWFPDNSWVLGPCIGSNADNCPQPFLAETPGTRQLFAVLGQPDASAFLMPTMKIENAAHDYVAPSAASMAAAVKTMVPNGGNGITRQYNEASTSSAAYPLTMVVYAMVPTGGVSHSKAAKIAQWLGYVAGPGQHQGMLPGQLPPGYLPLTAGMRAQTRKAAYEVLHQTGDHSKSSSSSSGHGGGNGGGGGGTGSGTGSGSGHNGSSGTNNGSSADKNTGRTSTANASFSSPFSGTGRLVLVILLIVGGLLALAGPTAVVLGKPGGRAAVVAGWRHVLALRHPARLLRGRKRH